MPESRSEEKHEGEFLGENQYAIQWNVGNALGKFKQGDLRELNLEWDDSLRPVRSS
jgi:hypothetical protein